MKRRVRVHRGRGLMATLGLLVSLVVSGGLALSFSHAQQADDPFETPSGAGEMYLLRRLGLIPEPTPPTRAAARAESLSAFEAFELGGDVGVNNPANDTPENTTQSETALAVFGNTVCAGYNTSGTGGLSGHARSANLGTAWTDLGGLGQSGDPVIAVHRASGTFYYGMLATIGGNPAIGIAASTDDCQTFGNPVDAGPAASASAATTLNDKPWIAIDNNGGAADGDIYVCWTRFFTPPMGTATSELRVSRSTDGGVTFVNEQVLEAAGSAPFGCSIGVGPGGQVYVVWANRAGATINDIRFSSSTDGGVNYGAPVSISTGNRHPGVDTTVTCPTGANPMATRPTLTGNIRMLHQAWLAVDTTGGPLDGNLYVVYASDPAGTPDNSDVFFIRSTNQGTNWSAPVQIGGGGGATDQFEPFVAVGGFGTVSIAWYDRRNDPANNNLIALYRTFSRDGGVTIDAIQQVSDVSFGVPPINPNFDPNIVNCYMGEYIAIAADQTNFYYAWGDNRNTVITANFPAPNGRLDPDVVFDSTAVPPITVQAPPIANAGPDQTVSAGANCTAQVTLNGTGSLDPNADPLTFTWTGPFIPPGAVNGATPLVTLPRGVHVITLTVDDGNGGIDQDTVTITVQDTTPPTFVSGLDPIVAEQTNLAGTPVNVPLPTATDNCDPSVTVVSDAPAVFPLGVTTVHFTATDDDGNQAQASTTVTIVDTTPPVITSASASPNSLWPPNHHMVPVTVAVSVTDICDLTPTCQIISVSSNEPDNGLGDGDTVGDAVITGDFTVSLRAERSGRGSGRVYTITVRCTDDSGNSATRTVEVTVAHDQGQ